MSIGNPDSGLLKQILALIREQGVQERYNTDRVTTELKKRSRYVWPMGVPKTPERTVNSYFSQNPEIFDCVGSNTYALRPSFLEKERQAQIEQRVAQLVATMEADCESIRAEYAAEDDTPSGRRSSAYYERDPRLRALAVAIHGTSCMVCGFNFGEFYGEWGRDYIEVHHVVPIAEIPESYETDPATDMVVLCSNCHRMIHRRRGSTLTPDELESNLTTHARGIGEMLRCPA